MATAQAVMPPSNVKLTLELTPTEAKILKMYMQNDLGPGEDPIMTEVRQAIWDALSAVSL